MDVGFVVVDVSWVFDEMWLDVTDVNFVEIEVGLISDVGFEVW